MPERLGETANVWMNAWSKGLSEQPIGILETKVGIMDKTIYGWNI